MSDAKQETIVEIVESMRRGTKLPGFWRSCDVNKILEFHADRIEMAWNREKAEIEADALSVGGVVEAARHSPCNAAAMRDAVVKALTLLNVCDWPSGVSLDCVGEVMREIDSVLDKPPRQCDVGTPDEQAQRFHNFCVGNSSGINGMCKPTCPCIDRFDKCQCLTKWAQTPYAQEGASK